MNYVQKKLRGLWLPSCALLLLLGCGKQEVAQPAPAPVPAQPAVKPAPPTPIAEKKEELGQPSWDPHWDLVVEKAFPPEMVSSKVARQVRSYCPRFASLSEADKRAFWAYTFQALAGAEAGLEPTVNVQHTEPEVAVLDSVTKHTVHQEGLLQLTYMDAKRYGCDFNWQQDRTLPAKDPKKTILKPENNLLCGIKIMNHQIVNQHKPLLVSSSYWVTLRPGTISYEVFAKQMKNVPAVCRQAAPAPMQEARMTRRPSTDTAAGAGTTAGPTETTAVVIPAAAH
jgi:hypothetical protein